MDTQHSARLYSRRDARILRQWRDVEDVSKWELETPVLYVDPDLLEANLDKMAPTMPANSIARDTMQRQINIPSSLICK